LQLHALRIVHLHAMGSEPQVGALAADDHRAEVLISLRAPSWRRAIGAAAVVALGFLAGFGGFIGGRSELLAAGWVRALRLAASEFAHAVHQRIAVVKAVAVVVRLAQPRPQSQCSAV
jgi:hypothetical protein